MSGGWAVRRFWDRAGVVETAAGFGVALDGRPLRTPAKAALTLPSRALAEAIAAEWDAQQGQVDPLAMPLTRAANSAIDKVTPMFAAVVDEVARYGGTDLLCYRATEPPALAARQAEAWDGLLDWAAAALGARLAVTRGVIPVAQPEAALAALRRRVATADAFGLTALHDLVAISGSLVIGLAVAAGRIAPDQGWSLSRIDEDWQAGLWGRDDEAERIAGLKRADFLAAARLWTLSRPA